MMEIRTLYDFASTNWTNPSSVQAPARTVSKCMWWTACDVGDACVYMCCAPIPFAQLSVYALDIPEMHAKLFVMHIIICTPYFNKKNTRMTRVRRLSILR